MHREKTTQDRTWVSVSEHWRLDECATGYRCASRRPYLDDRGGWPASRRHDRREPAPNDGTDRKAGGVYGCCTGHLRVKSKAVFKRRASIYGDECVVRIINESRQFQGAVYKRWGKYGKTE